MTRALGQGELLEAGKPRRLIVPPAHGAWFGVDPSTVRVAIASVTGEGRRGVSVASFPSLEGPARLGVIYRETRLLARSVADAVGMPGVVACEQPSGQTPNPNLVYAVGVVLAALVGELGGACVVTVPSSTWKSVACGNGAIYKPKRVKGGVAPVAEDYGVLRWARGLGYVGSSWDAADAWGVCEWARRTFELVER